MKKRTFLKTSSALVAGSFLAPLSACLPDKGSQSEKPMSKRSNWAGNLQYSTDILHKPKDVEGVQMIVRQSKKLRVLGSRHCFNPIADSQYAQLSSELLNGIVDLNPEAQTVTVEAGMRYGDLAPQLHEKGFAIHNLASLPHISIAGACATATHGSGVTNGNLATPVQAIEFVDGTGEVVQLSREHDPDIFPGVVVHLGALGVITKLTLEIEPTYHVRQDVYLNLPISQLTAHMDEILAAGYSVSLFTDWQSDTVNQVWIKRRIDQTDEGEADLTFFGAKLVDRDVHPIIELSAENCTEQMGVPGIWYERLPHFKMGFTPSSGKELQAEYFVPRAQAAEAFMAITELKAALKPYLMITEIRTIAADDFWMSPHYGQDMLAIHFTLEQDWEGVQHLLPKIEAQLMPFGVKPHWGKNFTFSPEYLQSQYPKLSDFKALMARFDPAGKFRNQFIDQNLF